MNTHRDIIIIGAGPAGLSAAVTAAGYGLDVLVVDEQPSPGGQIYRNIKRALTEEMVWDPQTGVLLNRNLLDYKIATIKDCPKADTMIVETEMGHGPYGTVGVGEDIAANAPHIFLKLRYFILQHDERLDRQLAYFRRSQCRNCEFVVLVMRYADKVAWLHEGHHLPSSGRG